MPRLRSMQPIGWKGLEDKPPWRQDGWVAPPCSLGEGGLTCVLTLVDLGFLAPPFQGSVLLPGAPPLPVIGLHALACSTRTPLLRLLLSVFLSIGLAAASQFLFEYCRCPSSSKPYPFGLGCTKRTSVFAGQYDLEFFCQVPSSRLEA